jgi:hypothetical protein
MTMIHAVELVRALRLTPDLAYRMPLSRIDGALAALSSSAAIGSAYRTLCDARERKCGIADPSGRVWAESR